MQKLEGSSLKKN
uniref:Uncharacterized protein n=1 Tax=Anguilla anguilla TaxID=7936 RepID=A0A0E9S9Z8_ANGAN